MTTRGRLLVASPSLVDPNFRFAVVFMLEHGDEGALGLVLTRPSELPVGDLFEAWSGHARSPTVVYRGGPVEPSAVIALGVTDERTASPAFNEVVAGIGTVDLDTHPDEVTPLRGIRTFAGYSGWSAGQLEGELVDDAWLVVDADPTDVLHPDPARLWWDVVGRQGDGTAMLRHYPEEPGLN